ncbi:MAG: PAS domain-containing protein [Alphaproteobacteria bacterium]|uniref:histidine kinase n=1 Tax=Candidatus Nitrobium versatile TaxID=2884831 RepID=A0A953M2K8_9BACT|nr:PAS domain-containing protein [Candidatus Nitrobium versatile]
MEKEDAGLSRKEYQVLVEQAPIMIWRSDTSTGCDYFNERWLAFTGRTLEQERGNGWAEGVHPDDFQRCLDIYLASFKNREVFEMEYRLWRHDGVYRWIFDRGAPFYDDEGVFMGYIGSCIDVTDRVEAQKALRKAQEEEVTRLRELIPICASCKKIRDDQGYWTQVESYMAKYIKADFSHGICPDCLKKLYPAQYGKMFREEER